jgi:hypothetical protein
MKDNKQLKQILWLQVASVVLYLALGILAIIFMNRTTLDLVVNYLTNNSLLGQSNTVFVSAVHVLISPEVRVYVAIIMTLSLAYPVKFFWFYKRDNVKKTSPQLHKIRWLDWAFIGTLMFLVIAALSGIQDLMTLITIGSLMALTYVFCWLGVHNLDSKPVLAKGSVGMSIISGTIAWIVVLVSALGTWVYGLVRSPWYIYVLYLLGLVNFLILLLIFRYIRANKKINNLWFEKNLLAINMTIKIIFALVLIIGLRR